MPDLLNHYSTQDLGIEAYYLCLTTSPTNRFSTPSTNCQIMTVIWHLISWPSIKSLICRVKVPMAGSGCSPTPLAATDISAMDDSSFKVGRLSVEERKEKIDRYMKKRAERNFSKKIKYACRKTLADSRPRVRGRFAKNDELGETAKSGSSNNDFDDEGEVAVKEEDILDSDILTHISGVNSFSYNFTLESWI
ncbi:unnamed protein product [Musa acuminata var. zebrina]